jgi:hypothetical protein
MNNCKSKLGKIINAELVLQLSYKCSVIDPPQGVSTLVLSPSVYGAIPYTQFPQYFGPEPMTIL